MTGMCVLLGIWASMGMMMQLGVRMRMFHCYEKNPRVWEECSGVNFGLSCRCRSGQNPARQWLHRAQNLEPSR